MPVISNKPMEIESRDNGESPPGSAQPGGDVPESVIRTVAARQGVTEELVQRILADTEDELDRKFSAATVDKTIMPASRCMERMVDIFDYTYKNFRLTAFYALMHIWGEPCLDRIVGFKNYEEFGRAVNKTKAQVAWDVMKAQLHFHTDPRPDQRDFEQRDAMRRSRIARQEWRNGKLKGTKAA